VICEVIEEEGRKGGCDGLVVKIKGGLQGLGLHNE
jgi:hypothetical protein